MPHLDVDELQAILNTSFPGSGVPRVEQVTEEGVVVRQVIDERHSRPGATVSGPTLMSLADTAAWMAVLSRVGPALLAVTTSLHIDFLRKPALTEVLARARILKLGRRLGVIDVEMTSAGSSDLVAKAQVTYSLPPERS